MKKLITEIIYNPFKLDVKAFILNQQFKMYRVLLKKRYKAKHHIVTFSIFIRIFIIIS
jgi:hypothetical protein